MADETTSESVTIPKKVGVLVSIAVRSMVDVRTTHETVIAAAKAVIAHREFSVRVASAKKWATPAEFLSFLDIEEDLDSMLLDAWHRVMAGAEFAIMSEAFRRSAEVLSSAATRPGASRSR